MPLNKKARAYALAAQLEPLGVYTTEAAQLLREQADEIERLWEWRTTGGDGHTHQCRHCAFLYTPAADAETEDCPRCGSNGSDDWPGAKTARPVSGPVPASFDPSDHYMLPRDEPDTMRWPD